MNTAAIFSDLHLPNELSDDYQLFLDTLESFERGKTISELWLLGDIFDCLVGDQEFWITTHQAFWQQLQRLAKTGVKVLYFEGNHDFAFKKIAIQHGVHAYSEGRCHLFQGRRVFLSHGDELDVDNEAYARWRAFTKSPRTRNIYRSLPQLLTRKFLVPFAETYSGYRKRKRDPLHFENETQHYREKYRGFAEKVIREKAYHAAFLGHSHIKELEIFGATTFYCNLGSWLGDDKLFALWTPEESNHPKVLPAQTWVESLPKV